MKQLATVTASALALLASSAYASDKAAPHWSYSGEGGPANWGKISEDFHVCGGGPTQSPIDIKTTIEADLPPIGFSYTAFPLKVLNNGHTLQVNAPEGSSIKIGKDVYQLLQLHFHTPSEYHIDGKSYPLEVHFVHKRADDALGVVGVMFTKGKENAALASILAHAPSKASETYISDKTIDVTEMLPTDRRYFRFMGSLTTPPCSEGVHWHMMTTPITASEAQLEKFKGFFPMNARPLQPANHRMVVKDSK